MTGCDRCMNTGRIVFGTDTETGRESIPCPHRLQERTAVPAEETFFAPDLGHVFRPTGPASPDDAHSRISAINFRVAELSHKSLWTAADFQTAAQIHKEIDAILFP